MLRRFIPKGKSISDYTADEICFFADCINGLPRKMLDYATDVYKRQERILNVLTMMGGGISDVR